MRTPNMRYLLGPLLVFFLTIIPIIESKAVKIRNTVLIVSSDKPNADTVTGTLDGYGIPYEVLLVPQGGTPLPPLNSTSGDANYGLILVVSQVSYNYGDMWRSALQADQWKTMYDYQVMYGK